MLSYAMSLFPIHDTRRREKNIKKKKAREEVDASELRASVGRIRNSAD
jgi:hypothetical protein